MKKIIIAEFKHETNSFTPSITDEQAFRNRNYLFGEEIIGRFTGVKNEIGAFLDFFSDRTDYCLIPTIAFNAQPGGIVSQAVFETAQKTIIEVIRRTEKVDGILLALHGAMVTEAHQDGEGELVEKLRREVKDKVPILTTLDLHTNLTAKMVENCDGMFVYDYYPHTDTYEAGLRAAKCMYETLERKIKPVIKYRKLDILLPYMPTAEPVMDKFVKEAQELREQENIINVNICHGFFSADIYEQGMAVVAVTDNDAELAQDIADHIGNKIWDARAKLHRKFYTIDQAIDEAEASEGSPFVFADVADNPGAGATCDGTHMLRRLMERNVKNVAVALIYDPEVVQQAEKAGVGETIHINLGGKISPEIAGYPIECDAYVKALTDGKFYNKDYLKGVLTLLGKTTVLDINGIYVIVSSIRTQPWDLEVYRVNGIVPEDMKILVVKSTIHYRASYGKIAYKILDVELPGLAPQSPEMLTYKHTRRPIYPLDEL